MLGKYDNSNRYGSSYVKCPFYHCEESQKIHCEGVQKHTSVHIAFSSKAEKRRYKKEYCDTDKRYSRCLIAKTLLDNKYKGNK